MDAPCKSTHRVFFMIAVGAAAGGLFSKLRRARGCGAGVTICAAICQCFRAGVRVRVCPLFLFVVRILGAVLTLVCRHLPYSRMGRRVCPGRKILRLTITVFIFNCWNSLLRRLFCALALCLFSAKWRSLLATDKTASLRPLFIQTPTPAHRSVLWFVA